MTLQSSLNLTLTKESWIWVNLIQELVWQDHQQSKTIKQATIHSLKGVKKHGMRCHSRNRKIWTLRWKLLKSGNYGKRLIKRQGACQRVLAPHKLNLLLVAQRLGFVFKLEAIVLTLKLQRIQGGSRKRIKSHLNSKWKQHLNRKSLSSQLMLNYKTIVMITQLAHLQSPAKVKIYSKNRMQSMKIRLQSKILIKTKDSKR